MEPTGERREPLDRPVFPRLAITPVSQREPGPPSRPILVWRGIIIAFGVLVAVGLWDHPAAALFAWVFAFLGLGLTTMVGRMLGTVAAILALGIFAGIWPERGALFLDTPEELARHVLGLRAMTAGTIIAAGIGWIALGVGRRYREREQERHGPISFDP